MVGTLRNCMPYPFALQGSAYPTYFLFSLFRPFLFSFFRARSQQVHKRCSLVSVVKKMLVRSAVHFVRRNWLRCALTALVFSRVSEYAERNGPYWEPDAAYLHWSTDVPAVTVCRRPHDAERFIISLQQRSRRFDTPCHFFNVIYREQIMTKKKKEKPSVFFFVVVDILRTRILVILNTVSNNYTEGAKRRKYCLKRFQ